MDRIDTRNDFMGTRITSTTPRQTFVCIAMGIDNTRRAYMRPRHDCGTPRQTDGVPRNEIFLARMPDMVVTISDKEKPVAFVWQ